MTIYKIRHIKSGHISSMPYQTMTAAELGILELVDVLLDQDIIVSTTDYEVVQMIGHGPCQI